MPLASLRAIPVCWSASISAVSWACVRKPFFVMSRDHSRFRAARSFSNLAGLDVLPDELKILRVNSVSIFAQCDLVDLEDGLSLLHPRLGLGKANELGLELVFEGGGVELANDVALLDDASLGQDGHDPG